MKKYWILVLASALFVGGCAIEAVETVPEETVVTRTDPPFEGAVWIDAEYNWNAGRYVVVPAHWEHSRGHWERGRWDHSKRGYRWVHGRWN